MKRITLVSFAFLSFAVGTINSRAAVITFTNTLPASDVLVSNTVASGTTSRQFHNMNGSTTPINRWVGVGFQAPSVGYLDKMTFFIYNNLVGTSVPGALMTFSIYSLSSLTAAPASSATPLYTETGTVPGTYSTENYITFDLTTPYALTSGSNYGVALEFNDTSSGSTRYMNLWLFGTPGNGNRGSEYYTNDSGATWTADAISLGFVVQTVPEPSIVGLGIVAAVAFGIRRRLRRTV